MKRVVIGLVGPIASGKGFLAEDLIKRGFAYWSLSDRVREEVNRRGLPWERRVLQDVGNELRQTAGSFVLVKQTLAMIPVETELVLIDSIRNPMELDYLKVMGATIIGVDASIENRLKWYLARAKGRGEDGTNEAEFFRANARDLGEGEDGYGQQGNACLRAADIRLNNDGTDKFLLECRKFLRAELGLNLEGKSSDKEKR